MESTVEEEVEVQNDTRTLVAHPDESDQQTERILYLQSMMAISGIEESPYAKDVVRKWRKFFDYLSWFIYRRVKIPFASYIQPKKVTLRSRRDFPKLIGLIKASAFLNPKNRMIESIGGEEYIIAELEDYEVARSVFATTMKDIHGGKLQEFAGLLRCFVKEKNKTTFTISELVRFCNTPEPTIRRRVESALNGGMIKIFYSSKPVIYAVNNLNVEVPDVLPSVGEVKHKFQSFKIRQMDLKEENDGKSDICEESFNFSEDLREYLHEHGKE